MQRPRLPELAITGLATVLLVGSVVGFANAADGGGGGPVVPGAVRIEGFAFGPDAVTVHAGAMVTWTNFDGATHTVTQNGALLDSPDLHTGDTYVATFPEPGTYEYFCKFHPAMQATITVEG
ncbi:MAG: plastocyanin/azurin family copper-binding protein [Acidimicrobiales bacterium]